MTEPDDLFSDDAAKRGQRRVLPFRTGELPVDLGVVQRVEFTDKRCNLTLKNTLSVKQNVHVLVCVLNGDLVELWRQTERWRMSSLQPDQSHLVSWEFKPEVPEAVWSERMRDNDEPAWIVVYCY